MTSDGAAAASLRSRYRRWRASTLGAVTDRLEYELLDELLGAVAGRRLLDIGCGDGALARHLTSRGASVTGLDADPAAVAVAAAQGGGCFIIGRAEKLPFADASFDAVTSVTTLCLLQDAPAAVAEMARVTRPGGRVVIGELGRLSLWAAWRRLKALGGDPVWTSARFWSAGELHRLIAGAGLRIEATRGAIYYPPLGWAARAVAPVDRRIGRLTRFGASFLAVAATRA